ncbi:unnamed protein product [Ceratitis capitata]|uniref:(Mediterranean fruit fly) hypothetical protein n=1 Tax=Ceratitis capitata TaxID=7213 RepID=A0A811UWR1_CERCA|nr:unnamed protein product [Ceratitis capitata]
MSFMIFICHRIRREFSRFIAKTRISTLRHFPTPHALNCKSLLFVRRQLSKPSLVTTLERAAAAGSNRIGKWPATLKKGVKRAKEKENQHLGSDVGPLSVV